MSLCDKKVSVMKRLIQIVLISAIIIPSCGGGGNSGLKDDGRDQYNLNQTFHNTNFFIA
jgi:hypothetical protein